MKHGVYRGIQAVFVVTLFSSVWIIFGDRLPLFGSFEQTSEQTSGRLELVTFSVLALSGAALMLRGAWRRAREGSRFYKAMFWFLVLGSAILLVIIGGFLRLAT